jgi:ribonuclease-3
LEFLGDSVLGFSIATELYDAYPDLSEGALSRIRADVVSRRSCERVGRVLGLDRMLVERVPDGEALAASTNVVAAVLESVLGVLFLEVGIEAIRGAIADAFFGIAEESRESGPDSKTQLQELLARRGLSASYTLLDTQGPPHDRHFRCAVVIDGEVYGVGEGRSKKDAEQIAATEALEKLGSESSPE